MKATLVIARVFALAIFALGGCATVDPIETSGDPGKLPHFSTYRVHEEQLAFATDISDEERAKVAAELRKAVVSALNDRGYKEDANPDVLVSLGAASRATFETIEQTDSRVRNVDPSVVEAGRPTPVPEPDRLAADVRREGDLFFYLLDPKTKRVIWRASANGSATTPSEATRRARAAYGAMIAKLPKAG